MKDLINELKALIINPEKGATGYTVLRCSERVVAHKINTIIIKLEQQKIKI